MTQKALLQSAGDGTAVPAGYVGQILSNEGSTQASVGGTTTDLVVLNIPQGVWQITFQSSCYVYESTATWEAQIFPSFGPSNTLIFFDNSWGFVMKKLASGNTYARSTLCMQTVVNLTSATDYKIRRTDNSGTGTKSLWGQIIAVRIA